MELTGNEVSAVNQQRRIEELSKSPAGAALESGSAVAGSVAALGTSLAAGGVSGLAIAGSVVAGMGIVDWFRKLGTSKVSENLEALGQATEEALSRVERVLTEQGKSIEEIKQRLGSKDFKDAMASASLQALRTTRQERLKRLALILANGVRANDAPAEGTDDMMRVAVELSERDIVVLKRVAETQAKFGIHFALDSTDGPLNRPREVWQELYREGFITTKNHMEMRSSLARLQSLGLGAEIQTMESNWMPRFLVTPNGERFLSRLEEISN